MKFLRTTLAGLRRTEPSVLRAHVVAIIGLLVDLGVTLPGWVNTDVTIAFAALTIIAPYYQGLRTRQDVWSQQTIDDLIHLSQLFPEWTAKARQLLGEGMSKWDVAGELQRLEAAWQASHQPDPTPPAALASTDQAPLVSAGELAALNTDDPVGPIPAEPVDRTPQPIELEAQAAATSPSIPAAGAADTAVIPTVGQPPVPAGATAAPAA